MEDPPGVALPARASLSLRHCRTIPRMTSVGHGLCLYGRERHAAPVHGAVGLKAGVSLAHAGMIADVAQRGKIGQAREASQQGAIPCPDAAG